MRNIKRFPIVLIMAVMLVLTACGGGNSGSSTPTPNPPPVQTVQYTVTFNTNGGYNVPPSQRVNSGATVAEPNAPTRNHHEFDGWYRDSALTTPATFPITVTQNIALYAGWKQIVYTQRPSGNGWYVQSEHNLIDERFELMGIITRLMKCDPYGRPRTDYHRLLDERFGEYADHPVINYWAKNTGPCFLWHLAYNIRVDGRGVINNSAWNLYPGYYDLVMDFYIETNFREFFEGNLFYYEEIARRYQKNVLDQFDWNWYADRFDPPETLRGVQIIGQLAIPAYGAAFPVNTNGMFAIMDGNMGNDTSYLGTILHEVGHHFTRYIAEELYYGNAQFKAWCDETVNDPNNLTYNTGYSVATEYVTDIYSIFYQVERGYLNATERYIAGSTGNGAIRLYRKEVFDFMIEYEASQGRFPMAG